MTNEVQTSDLQINLVEHSICWVLPPGASMWGNIELPGGALIQGKLIGKIYCKSGSLIIESGAELIGHAKADRVYVAGKVSNSPKGEVSSLYGRNLVAISEKAEGAAKLTAQAFAIHTRTFSAQLTTLPRP